MAMDSFLSRELAEAAAVELREYRSRRLLTSRTLR